MITKKEKTEQMLTGNPRKLILQFAIPAVFTALTGSLYNIVDRIFIGNGAGVTGLSAVTVSFVAMNVINAFIMLIGIGGSALFSIRLGEGKKQEAENIIQISFRLLMLGGIIFTMSGLVFLKPVSRLCGASEQSLAETIIYLRIIFIGSIPQCLGGGLVYFIRAEGSPQFAMGVSIAGTAVNCLFDPLFIFVFKMGISGAAIATIMSYAVVAIFTLEYYVSKKRSSFHLHCNAKALRFKSVSDILRLGFSGFSMQLIVTLLAFVLNNSLNYYGTRNGISVDLAISAQGIATTVGGLLTTFGVGMQQASGVLIGINYGAKQKGRVKQLFYISFVYLILVLMFFYIGIMLFPAPIASIFGTVEDKEFISYTMRAFNFALPLLPFQMLGCMFFQATNQPKKANLLGVCRGLFFAIPLMLILPPFFGIKILMCCPSFADIGTAIISFFILRQEFRKMDTDRFNRL